MWFLAQASPGETSSAWQGVLTFVQSMATFIGQGLVRLCNLILPPSRPLGEDMVLPLGYLGLLTAVLLVFDLLAAARKAIWIVVGIGWLLLILRIVLWALGIQ
ncbi:MAG: hypothetical protein ACP5LJ_05960 [Candidatus Bipolaricaulaceae bacterium]